MTEESIEVEIPEVPLEFLKVSNMYDKSGVMNMTVGLNFLNMAITTQAQEQGIITNRDFLEIQNFVFNGNDFQFKCDLYSYLMV